MQRFGSIGGVYVMASDPQGNRIELSEQPPGPAAGLPGLPCSMGRSGQGHDGDSVC
jgi:hypothetical protein